MSTSMSVSWSGKWMKMLSGEWLEPCQASSIRSLVAHAVGGGDLVHGPLQVVADCRGRVEQHDAVAGGHERRLLSAVGDAVEVPLHASHVVALVIECGAKRGRGDRRVVRQVRGAGSA